MITDMNFELLTNEEALEMILKGDEQSDLVMYYLIQRKYAGKLLHIYLKYARLLSDDFEDLTGNFFIYMRDGRKSESRRAYAGLERVRDSSKLGSYLCSAFLIAASVIAYAHQTSSPEGKLCLMYMMMRAIDRRSTPDSRTMAIALGTTGISLRAASFRIRRRMKKYRDKLRNGERLPLDKEHQLMRDRINDAFGKDLRDAIFYYYRIEYWKHTGHIL